MTVTTCIYNIIRYSWHIYRVTRIWPVMCFLQISHAATYQYCGASDRCDFDQIDITRYCIVQHWSKMNLIEIHEHKYFWTMKQWNEQSWNKTKKHCPNISKIQYQTCRKRQNWFTSNIQIHDRSFPGLVQERLWYQWTKYH